MAMKVMVTAIGLFIRKLTIQVVSGCFSLFQVCFRLFQVCFRLFQVVSGLFQVCFRLFQVVSFIFVAFIFGFI